MAGTIQDEERGKTNVDEGDEQSKMPSDSPNDERDDSSTLRIAESDVLRTRRKFSHTSEAQRLSVLEWLEQPPNFQLLAGGRDGSAPSPSPVVNAEGKKLKKTDGFRSLMRHVNARTQSQWSLDVTRSRFESLLAAFRKTRAIAARPDFHVSANDRVRGITDTRQKLNALCMCYDRLEALFTTGKPLKAPETSAPKGASTTTGTTEPVAGVSGKKNAGGVDPDGGRKAVVKLNAQDSSDTAKKTDKASGDPQSISQGGGFVAAKAKAAAAVSDGKGDKAGNGKADASDDAQKNQLQEEKGAAATRDDPKGDTAGAERVENAAVGVVSEAAFSSPSAKRLKLHHQSSDTEPGSSTKSPAPTATTASREEYQLAPVVVEAAAPVTPSAVEPAATISHEDAVRLKTLEVEAQKLALQQEQLQLQKRELELKEKELVAQESMKKQSVRADLTTKLVVAGKSLSEIKEFLALLD